MSSKYITVDVYWSLQYIAIKHERLWLSTSLLLSQYDKIKIKTATEFISHENIINHPKTNQGLPKWILSLVTRFQLLRSATDVLQAISEFSRYEVNTHISRISSGNLIASFRAGFQSILSVLLSEIANTQLSSYRRMIK